MPPDKSLAAKTGTCPICSRPSDIHYRPFCSRRCADVDLSRWLSGAYAIPDATESEDGDSAEPAGSPDCDREQGKSEPAAPSSRRRG